jgi:hypothetical protein
MLYLLGEETNGKPAGQGLRRSRQDNIKMYLTEIGW